jgi:hypothetical protein
MLSPAKTSNSGEYDGPPAVELLNVFRLPFGEVGDRATVALAKKLVDDW